jgi:hypothetical protein
MGIFTGEFDLDMLREDGLREGGDYHRRLFFAKELLNSGVSPIFNLL